MKRLLSTLLMSMMLMTATLVMAQNRTITGSVKSNENGQEAGLPGVNVVADGTTTGTITDVDGNFTLEVPESASSLTFSSIGYKTQVVNVAGQSTVSITMESDVNTIDEVVVVGYGSQKKVEITGAVVQIKGDELAKQTAQNPISSLQGKVAGVQITNSGKPGAAPEIKIRGTGTVYGSNSPLYIVNGIWYDDISFLNPADIESLSVLKDAASESIYGVRAANGVVLITAKKGALNRKPTFQYNSYVGNYVVTNPVQMASGPEYATIVNELDVILKREGGPRYKNPNGFGTTDWFGQILRNAFTTNHQLALSGGGETSTYNVSFGYFRQNGIVKKNNLDRYTIAIQNDFYPSRFFRLGYSVTGAINAYKDIDGGIFHQSYSAAPIVPVYYADGTYGDPSDFETGSSNNFNPQVTLDFYRQTAAWNRLTGNVYAEAFLTKSLSFRSSIGGDWNLAPIKNYSPVYTATLGSRSDNSTLTRTTSESKNWLLENTLTFQHTFNGGHDLKVLLGQGAQSYRTYNITESAKGVPDDSEGSHYFKLADQKTFTISDYGFYSTVASYFGRLNYNYKGKYLLMTSLRSDGSSKFSGNNRRGIFPSVGAGWVISSEQFMENSKIFNFLKLRGSWGVIGNSSVPANLSTVVVDTEDIYVDAQGVVHPTGTIKKVVPPTTYWEKGVGIDLGLEASFLQKRLTLEVDAYNRKTIDAIFDIPILGSLGTGSGSIIANQADFQNQGLEVVLGWKEDNGEGFSYSINGNIGLNENKVLSVKTGQNAIFKAVGTTGGAYNTRTVAGEPIGHFYGKKVIGIFQTDADVKEYKDADGKVIQSAALPGDFKYEDINKDGVIDDKDRIVLGNPNAKYNYGISINAAVRQFDFTLDFQGVAQVDLYNAKWVRRYGTENYTRHFYDHRWHGEGTSNTYPSANIGGGQNYHSNSFYVQKGDYFRIRNFQVGYTLPKLKANQLKMSKCRFYISTQNPLTLFDYKGFSPEIGGKPTEAGVDTDIYPLFACYLFGFNLTF